MSIRIRKEGLKILRFVNSLSKGSEVKNSKAEMRFFPHLTFPNSRILKMADK